MTQQKNLTFKQQMEGFPYWQMIVVSLIRFSEPISFTSLFPYVFYMVRDFKIAPTEQDIPTYTAYLASSYALCQFIFAVKWGKLSDRIGRKKVLLCGLFGTSISLIIFGFSKNFYMALIARCFAGCLNGNISVLRTIIGEIATEKRHQALAFSMLPLLFNLGSVIGPGIGGSIYFTRPNPNNPYDDDHNKSMGTNGIYDSFLDHHPYALSNIVVSCFLWFSMICGFLFLEETQEDVKNNRDYGIELGDWLLYHFFNIKPKLRPWKVSHELQPLLIDNNSIHSQIFDDDDETDIIESSNVNSIENESSINKPDDNDDDDDDESNTKDDEIQSISPFLSRSMSKAIVRTYSEHNDESTNNQLVTLLDKDRYKGAFTPRVISVIAANFIISFHNNVFSEFLPVFLASRFQREKLQWPFKIAGGFGYSVSSIGTLFSSTGVMGMIIVVFIFPLIDRKLGTINGYRLSVSVFPLVHFLVPQAIFTLHSYNEKFPTWVTPIVLYCLTSLRTLASATGMPQVMLLQHRATTKNHRAYINSSTMSFIALARFFGPMIFGYLMSFGDIHNVGWLPWYILSFLSFLGWIQSFTMRDYDDDSH